MNQNILPVTGRNYVMTSRYRSDQPCIALQKNVTIDGDVAAQTMKIKVTGVEMGKDSQGREYAYFGYEPILEDQDMCKFGKDKVYVDPATQPKFTTTLAALS